jgi:hypothetical protein
LGIRWEIPLFPLWKRGMKGDFTAFQKTKRLLISLRTSNSRLQAGKDDWTLDRKDN